MFDIPPGNNLRSRLSGMLVKNMYIAAGECLSSAGGYPTSLRLITALLGESALTCWITLWGIKIYWLCSSAYLGTLVDRTIRLLGQLIIAPVSEVGEEDLWDADSC